MNELDIKTVINWEAGKVIPKSKHAILRKLLDEKCEAEKVHGNLIPFYNDVASIGGNNEYVDTGGIGLKMLRPLSGITGKVW